MRVNDSAAIRATGSFVNLQSDWIRSWAHTGMVLILIKTSHTLVGFAKLAVDHALRADK